jgi:signal peptidase I
VVRAVLVIVLGIILRTWLIEGLFVPLKVSSGSMAETLLGPHRVVTCGDCGYRFPCGAETRTSARGAVCPNCGFADNDLAGRPVVDGDRILVEKSAFGLRPPRRWEVVAFRHPERPRETVVKRVVGLPGEAIQIRDGDVYVGGAIQRKDLARQRAMAVLVYDADFSPTGSVWMPARWQSDPSGAASGGWEAGDGRFRHRSAATTASVDWLVYRHWRRLPGPEGKAEESPITNARGYNQPPRERAENVYSIGDLLLSFRVLTSSGRGDLLLRATDGGDEFTVRLHADQGVYEVLRNGRPLADARGRGTLPDLSREVQIEVSLIDRQFLLALDGRTAASYPYEPSDGSRTPSVGPLAIGSNGLGVEVGSLRVYRDVYYTRPIGPSGRWGLDAEANLSGGEWFVLGDNSPLSEDSRTWPSGPGVPASLLIGKPLLVHFPACRVDLGRWHFQVPNPARIRYIR